MTASMIVTCGVQFSPGGRWAREDAEDRRVTLSVRIDAEIDPEQVWVACNRIDSLEHDLGRLPHEWQRTLRRQLDERRAPSMSVEDTVEIFGPQACASGVIDARIIGWRAESFGFSVLPQPSKETPCGS